MQKQTTNFEISKLLKAKGWNIPTLHYFLEDGVLIKNLFQDTVGMDYGSAFVVDFGEMLENWNDGWLTNKNGKRCFGCSKSKGYFETFSAPMILDVVMWLPETYGIWIEVIETDLFGKFFFQIKRKDNTRLKNGDYNTPIEAYEAGIQYVLENFDKIFLTK